MTVRFRIRTPGGQELSFASRKMFEDFVRSGDLSPDDLVYDRETGSWSPARTHPAVLDIRHELQAEQRATADEAPADGASADGASGDDEEAGAATRAGADLDLALTEEVSPEDEKRAFVEKLAAERQADLGAGATAREELSGFTMEDAGSFGEMLQAAPPPRVPDPPAAPRRERPRRDGPGPRDRPEPSRREESASTRKGWLARTIGVVLLVALLGAAGYAGLTLFEAREAEPPVEEPDAEAPVEAVAVEPSPVPPREPVIPATVPAVRERARERYLASTQERLRGLQSIPEAWAEGPYFVLPSRYPGVVDVWQSYLATVRDVRSTDVDRYRAAYRAALDDAAVEGEARATRLEAGMSDFARTAPMREAHFDRVETLAIAAIQSHNALLEAEGLILFDQTGSTGAGSGVGRGASGRDSESQLLLDQVLAVLQRALEAGGEGPGTGENVRAWVWDGFFDAATPSSVARPPSAPEGSPYG